VKPLIVDVLGTRENKRIIKRDTIGSGPRYVAGILEEYNFEPKIATFETYRKTKFTDYDILLVSGMTTDLSTIRRIIKRWKNESKQPVLIGGPVTSDPIKSIQKTRADIGVIGEGEKTLRDLLDNGLKDAILPEEDILSKIRGITYRIGKNIRSSGFRPRLSKDFYENIRPSTRRIKDYPLFYAARVYVEILRGCSNFYRSTIGPIGETCVGCGKCFYGTLDERYDCPSKIPPGCGYCSVPSLYGSPKSRPVESIKKEVSQLISEGVHRIVLSAPGFLDYRREDLVYPKPLTNPRSPEPNYEAIIELLSSLCDLKEISLGNTSLMIENVKSGLVTKKAAKILGQYLKGTTLNIGFETGSTQHSLSIGRPDTPEETYRSINRLKNVGLKPYVYFIHGLPGQTKDTANATVNAIKESVRLGSERVILYRFQSLPMSAFTLCPSGSPAIKNPTSKLIYDTAFKTNRNAKKIMIGSRISVVVAEQYDRDSRYMVAYPMKHGPVILLDKAEELVGKVITVTIQGIASNRMVYGTIY
jgi:radical SAM superfamily enzyme YgiQ (UPF0313 family)